MSSIIEAFEKKVVFLHFLQRVSSCAALFLDNLLYPTASVYNRESPLPLFLALDKGRSSSSDQVTVVFPPLTVITVKSLMVFCSALNVTHTATVIDNNSVSKIMICITKGEIHTSSIMRTWELVVLDCELYVKILNTGQKMRDTY